MLERGADVGGMVDLNGLALPALAAALGVEAEAGRLAAVSREEDLRWGSARGDVTSEAAAAAGWGAGLGGGAGDRGRLRGLIVCREDAVACGVALVGVMAEAFSGGALSVEAMVEDGARVEGGTAVAAVSGATADVLAFERTVLNVLSYTFGVSTTTRAYADACVEGGRGTHVLDTRKTLPGYRALSKYAVRCGGGLLHRVNLADAVLLKDNHVAGVADDALGSFVARVSEAARSRGPVRFVEVEVDRLSQLASVLTVEPGVVDYVLLDNMDDGMLSEAVAMRDRAGSSVELEASGGMTLERVARVARIGVERVSVGGLTQRSRAVDLGMDLRGG